MRFLIHWALRREELCDPGLCPDAPDEGGRCEHCPLDNLDAAQCSAIGHLIRRAIEIRQLLTLRLNISFDEIMADEYYCLALLSAEQQKYEQERLDEPSARNPI